MAGLLTLLTLSGALAQSGPPERRIPPEVLSEVAVLQNRFEVALAQDCPTDQCFSKGCVYVDHAVSDRAPPASMPGFGWGPEPEPEHAQVYLTRAQCAFAHEAEAEADFVGAVSRRVGTKLSSGWVGVAVTHQALAPLPVVEPEPEPEPEPEVEAPAPPPARSVLRELWEALLPHVWWMVGLGLFTLASTILIWAMRRVGQLSIDDQMLLAEVGRGPLEEERVPVATVEVDDAVETQTELWTSRLEAIEPEAPDLELQGMLRELLLTGAMPLLAKAMLTFPDTLPRAFPEGGDVASAKLALAAYLKSVNPDELPDDEAFFRELNKHAVAASIATQADARIVRALHDDFGASGLVSVVQELSARPAALLFALAPAATRDEMLRLLDPERITVLAGMLLRSNRMDPAETSHLFGVLEALRAGDALPEDPGLAVTDRGPVFDAVAALSALLESTHSDVRAGLFREARARAGGSLSDWTRGVLVSDMLLALPGEALADLMLGVEVAQLAGWLSLVESSRRAALVSQLPSTLQTALRASSVFRSRAEQLALAEAGRRSLAAGFAEQLVRSGQRFEDVVVRGSSDA